MSKPARILYFHCTYAQVVPPDVKNDVLRQLAESGVPFEAVADLCELSARRDPALKQYAAEANGDVTLKIAACYPRAVKWLFNAAGGRALYLDNVMQRMLRECLAAAAHHSLGWDSAAANYGRHMLKAAAENK